MSESILILSPAIGTDNIGDDIIMEGVRGELMPIIGKRFTYELPTHVSSFHWYQVWRNSSAIRHYTDCKYKFVGGSNLLVKDMLTHYPQWNVNLFNYKPFAGCVLVGVGASAGERTNFYTKHLYRKLLNRDYYHSVRDERTKAFIQDMGLKAINTGCATMWMLTPEFCKRIPQEKADSVVFTLTSYSRNRIQDKCLIEILQRNYKDIYFWVQDCNDLEYLRSFDGINNIKIVEPTKEAFDRLLTDKTIDYVGTRLHAGIYAMRHGRRSIIIVIDERAREINKCNNLVCIERDDVSERLEAMVISRFATEIHMPIDEIDRWKSQFY